MHACMQWTYWIDASSPTLAPVPCIPPAQTASRPEPPFATDVAWNPLWNADATHRAAFYALLTDGAIATYLIPGPPLYH